MIITTEIINPEKAQEYLLKAAPNRIIRTIDVKTTVDPAKSVYPINLKEI